MTLIVALKRAKSRIVKSNMAKRVTPDEIVKMHQLYAKYGNYAAVGREIGRSATTVAKYVNLKDTPEIVRHTFKEIVRG